VHDANATWPVIEEPTDDAESGRGLALVAALTGDRWGVSDRDGFGKRVWAVVADEGAGANLGDVG
jgi:serine/threonine-protein kinase RsbW